MSGYFLSPSNKKRGLGKKLITTWEGRELVTRLFLKIYHPFVSTLSPKNKGKKRRERKMVAEKWEIIYIYKISFRPRLFTVFTTHKLLSLSLVIKTLSTESTDSKMSTIKKNNKVLTLTFLSFVLKGKSLTIILKILLSFCPRSH